MDIGDRRRCLDLADRDKLDRVPGFNIPPEHGGGYRRVKDGRRVDIYLFSRTPAGGNANCRSHGRWLRRQSLTRRPVLRPFEWMKFKHVLTEPFHNWFPSWRRSCVILRYRVRNWTRSIPWLHSLLYM